MIQKGKVDFKMIFSCVQFVHRSNIHKMKHVCTVLGLSDFNLVHVISSGPLDKITWTADGQLLAVSTVKG